MAEWMTWLAFDPAQVWFFLLVALLGLGVRALACLVCSLYAARHADGDAAKLRFTCVDLARTYGVMLSTCGFAVSMRAFLPPGQLAVAVYGQLGLVVGAIQVAMLFALSVFLYFAALTAWASFRTATTPSVLFTDKLPNVFAHYMLSALTLLYGTMVSIPGGDVL